MFRQIVWNEDAEMAAIGSAMRGAKGLRPVVLLLNAEDFYKPCHVDVFQAIKDLAKAKKAVGFHTVCNLLDERGQLQGAGGQEYILQLMESVPGTNQANEYASIVKQDSQCRAVSAACNMANDEIHRRENLPEALSILRAAIRPVGTGGCIEVGDITDDRGADGVESVISLVNDKTDCGGWPIGQTSIIGAYPGGGKTTLLIQDFAHAASIGERVVYATFGDLDSREILRKVMRQATGWSAPPSQDILGGEWQKVHGDWKMVYDASIYDARNVQGGLGRKVGVFCDEMRSHNDKGKVHRIYVDYAQKIQPDKSSGNQVDDLQRISDELKTLAEELECAVIIGTQLTNSVEGPQPKGCRAIYEDCAVAVYVYWHNGVSTTAPYDVNWSLMRPDDGQDKTLLRLFKNRFGMLGRREYDWCDSKTKFKDVGK